MGAIVKNAVANGGGNPIMLQNNIANRPPAGIQGRLFVASDELLIYRDTGADWEVVGGNPSVIPTLQQVLTAGNVATDLEYVLEGNSATLVCVVTPNGITVRDYNTNDILNVLSTGINLANVNDPNKLFATDGSLKIVASGTYTPTASNTTNVTTITPLLARWQQIGDVVTVFGQVNVEPTSAVAALIEFNLSLPVPTGSLGGFTMAGTCSSTTGSSVIYGNAGIIEQAIGAARFQMTGVVNILYGVFYSYSYNIV